MADEMLVYMDGAQNDHLRAYGVTYWALSKGYKASWLLNYRGGSFLIDDAPEVEEKANLMGVSFTRITPTDYANILSVIANSNMDEVKLEKAPRVAVYTPPEVDPWDDAVTMVLTYADIPFDKIYDPDVLAGALDNYDWLHLHHEDFSGQYGKFYAAFHNATWYVKQEQDFIRQAKEAGYATVREHKGAIALKIREFVLRGGFLFAMCSATDSLDVALAALKTDIIAPEIDGTPIDPDYQKKLDFATCLAFTDFKLITSPFVYEFSDIDVDPQLVSGGPSRGDFTLFEFSAKLDRSPTILTQDHTNNIKGFMGQTTAFMKKVVKKNVIILGEINEEIVKYIYGTEGEGAFTFYGGHDPEDFEHFVGDRPTNVEKHKNSPGYRLILNNILFPAAKKKKLKT
jgi:hypothetical protein